MENQLWIWIETDDCIPEHHHVKLTYGVGTEKNDNPISVWECSIEHDECSQCPYAVFMTITDFFSHATLPFCPQTVHFFVDQLHTFNVLKYYLLKWIKNDFIDSQGHLIPFHDILKSFISSAKQYKYTCTYVRRH
jgi:hypothetical protein